MVVRLLVQGDLEVQFAVREGEALADKGTGQPGAATRGCELQLQPFIGPISCLLLRHTGLEVHTCSQFSYCLQPLLVLLALLLHYSSNIRGSHTRGYQQLCLLGYTAA